MMHRVILTCVIIARPSAAYYRHSTLWKKPHAIDKAIHYLIKMTIFEFDRLYRVPTFFHSHNEAAATHSQMLKEQILILRCSIIFN